MDAERLLRLYLEQRREMGERELVLDDLSVEEVLRIVGARRTARSSLTEGADWRAALRASSARAPSPQRDPSPGTTPPEPAVSRLTPTDDVAIPLEDRLREIDTLEGVAALVHDCRRCALYAEARNPVPGEGNPAAGFMCVGEAPGSSEDETGRPFVGAAGQLLTKILAAVNLRREDVFIANVLKHRPPANRNPLPPEIAACRPYLVRQIELIRPRVILALGTFAAQSLLETKLPISRLRGTVHSFLDVPVVVTYHPAALLRNPAWKRPTWEDVQLAHRIFHSSRA